MAQYLAIYDEELSEADIKHINQYCSIVPQRPKDVDVAQAVEVVLRVGYTNVPKPRLTIYWFGSDELNTTLSWLRLGNPVPVFIGEWADEDFETCVKLAKSLGDTKKLEEMAETVGDAFVLRCHEIRSNYKALPGYRIKREVETLVGTLHEISSWAYATVKMACAEFAGAKVWNRTERV